MKKVKIISLTASMVLAMVFTFSCSSDGGGENTYNNGSGCGENVSSSSLGGGFSGSYGSLLYEGQIYKTVVIGTQTWMAENLNYAVAGSKCYGEGLIAYWDKDGNFIIKELSDAEVQANCDKYGRLYDWATAMGLPSSCNEDSCSSQIQSKHRGICPSGWHIPSDDDWDKLLRYVDNENCGNGEHLYDRWGGPYNSYTAGKYLKAADGWNWNDYDGISGNGTDKYGFSALPGGGLDGSSFDIVGIVGDDGHWWSASRLGSYRSMYYDSEIAYLISISFIRKSDLFSVRCVQD
jgi:uncharacterized protein (TIGR02145 family)